MVSVETKHKLLMIGIYACAQLNDPHCGWSYGMEEENGCENFEHCQALWETIPLDIRYEIKNGSKKLLSALTEDSL